MHNHVKLHLLSNASSSVPECMSVCECVCVFECVCLSVYLVIPPEPGQAVGVHDAEDFALWILPADVVLVPAV